MGTNIFRGPLTDHLIEHLASSLASIDTGIKVGDGVIPHGVGWLGEPNAPTSSFQPYVVVIAGPASFSAGPLGDSQADWRFPYMIGSYNASRSGLDWMADRARQAVDGLRDAVYSLGEDQYKVQYVRVESIGGTNRVDATDPPYWGQTDGISIWMSKEF